MWTDQEHSMVGPYIGALLFAVGVLLNVGPAADLVRHLATESLDEGWVTLVGAVLGLSAIAWQTRRGFSHLISSQRNQAELDREARLEQLHLEREQQEWRERRESKVLSAALRGALIANYQAAINVKLHCSMMSIISKKIAEEHGSRESKIALSFKFDLSIFDVNNSRIGLLGADIAADVSQVFSELRIPESYNSDLSIDYKMQAVIYDGVSKGMDNVMEDIMHVTERLRVFESGGSDPGPLSQIKVKRFTNQTYSS